MTRAVPVFLAAIALFAASAQASPDPLTTCGSTVDPAAKSWRVCLDDE
ncbi:MAG TPA: hypothetical protein VN634_19545 [Candidatus Limnocylindrales bacterium]|nr:hypothetical protein [Candidatus Limnocylindrales bacterium]